MQGKAFGTFHFLQIALRFIMYFFVSQKALRATRKLPADASGGRWKKIHIIGIICSLNLMILTEVTRMIVDDFLIGNSFGIADFIARKSVSIRVARP